MIIDIVTEGRLKTTAEQRRTPSSHLPVFLRSPSSIITIINLCVFLRRCRRST